MKTFKTILAAVLFLTVSNGLMAQATSSESIEASAHVIQAISVAGERALDFGTVVAGTTKTIGLDGAATGAFTTMDGFETMQSGLFVVSAAPSSSVLLKFTDIPGVLTNGDNVEMEIEYIAGFGTNEAGTGTTGVNVEENAPTSIDLFPSHEIGDANGIYVFLGGSVTPAPDQAPGTYTAQITLTAEYN